MKECKKCKEKNKMLIEFAQEVFELKDKIKTLRIVKGIKEIVEENEDS